MKSYLLIFALTCIIGTAFSQKNSVSPEFAYRTKHFVNLNLNVPKPTNHFDKPLPFQPQFSRIRKSEAGYNRHFSLRTFADENYITFPQRMPAKFEKGIGLFEFGMGGTVAPSSILGHSFYSYPLFGIRIQPQTAKKLIIRIFGSYPFSGKFVDGPCILPLGVSAGFVVK